MARSQVERGAGGGSFREKKPEETRAERGHFLLTRRALWGGSGKGGKGGTRRDVRAVCGRRFLRKQIVKGGGLT